MDSIATLIKTVLIRSDWRLIPILEKIERTWDRVVFLLVALTRAVSAIEFPLERDSATRASDGVSPNNWVKASIAGARGCVGCQTAFTRDPRSASKRDPLFR